MELLGSQIPVPLPKLPVCLLERRSSCGAFAPESGVGNGPSRPGGIQGLGLVWAVGLGLGFGSGLTVLGLGLI